MREKDANWQDSADVIVAGYGGAGAVAAITAHDLGAEVLLLEKQPQDGHYTNTQMSGGMFICPTDVEKTIGYVETLYHVQEGLSWTDGPVLRAWAEYTHQNKAWAEGLGAKLIFRAYRGGPHRNIPGWECMECWSFAGGGFGMHHFLTSHVAKRGIRVRFNTPAHKLITDPDGAVVGVRVMEGGVPKDIRARKAVIMTTGGFAFNEAMKLNYLKVFPAYFAGTPANTGDGIRMTMELGADLWHMNSCVGMLLGKFPDFPVPFLMDFGGRNWMFRKEKAQATGDRPDPYIFVDRDALRFTRENIKAHILIYELSLFDSQRLIFPRIPSFWIFDQKRMDDGPLPGQRGGPSGPVRLYRWSKDNQTEMEKGWLVRGESIPDLAEKLGLPPAILEETVRRFNSYCQQGADPDFQRDPLDLVPLVNPPFYGMPLYPGGANTQGGPRRNHLSQVVNVDGDAIPRLYAAGELGSIYGLLYPSSGGNLAECIAFGRIAAENAVRETLRP